MNNYNQDRLEKLDRDYKIFAKNTVYSFMYIYSGFFLSLITSFLIARMISKELWGFLLIALSLIALFQTFLIFLPPSLGLSINYFIPRYYALKENKKLKNFLIYSITLRILFILLIFTISLISFYFLPVIYKTSLKNYTHLFLILSPLIIINGLNLVFYDVNRSLNFFKTVFYLLVLNYLIQICGLIFYILISNTFQVEIIALIILFSYLIPFLFNCIIIFYLLKFKIKVDKEEEGIKIKGFLKKLYGYGSHLSVQDFLVNFIKQFRVQTIGFLDSSESVLGYNIGNNYNHVVFEGISSFNRPLTVSFSKLDITEERYKIVRIYNVSLHYAVFLILLISGVLFFIVDFFLFIVYGESFLKYSLLLKLMVISIIFNIMTPFFFSLLRSSQKYKKIIPISLIISLIRIILFLTGLIFFGLYGAIILGALIADTIISFFSVILSFKFFKIQLNVIKACIQYLIFFISIGAVILLNELILEDINLLILRTLNIKILKYLEYFPIFFFIIIYLSLNIILKVFSNIDLQYLKAFFDKDEKSHRFVRKMIKLAEKVIRK
ncbi:MAG: lipopolysaccharide biosynthesis protein [Promethearchaeota archaeon]